MNLQSFIAIGVLVIIIILIVITNIKIVSQTNAYIIERLGSYNVTWLNGLHIKIPFIERVAAKITLKEQVIDFPPQPVITKDNVTIQIDTVVYFQVTDPKLYLYGVNHPISAIENLTATTLRNIVGELELDESLTSRDYINTKIRTVLDEATDPWGIKINRVELKNIIPPRDIQEAMEKQMRAEREKREAILIAEGKKASDILTSEGIKQAKILQAEGEAQAILVIKNAQADGLKMIKGVEPTNELIAIQSLEALAKVADGKATKLIVPSSIQNLTSLTASLAEIIKEPETK